MVDQARLESVNSRKVIEGSNPSLTASIESGVIKTPSVLMAQKIAKALGVSIEDLLK